MQRFLFLFALLAAASSLVHAAPTDLAEDGPYARIEVGHARLRSVDSPATSDPHQRGNTYKVFGGYRFSDQLGAEIGYVALGQFGEKATVEGVTAWRGVRAHSVYGAASGRMALGPSLALHGRLGLSFGRVTGADVLATGDEVTGHRRSLVFGAGVEYRPVPRVSLLVNYDNFGKVSSKAMADSLGASVDFRF